MGMREFRAWLRVTKRLQQGPEPDPDRWGGNVANFEAMRQKRDAMRGKR